MKYSLIKASILIFVTYLLSTSAFAIEAEPEHTNIAKYVSINIEIKELQEAGELLKDATKSLALALEQVSQNLDSLSPEQLVLINALAEKTENITNKLNLTLANIPNTIKQAQAPSSELLQQSLEQVKEATISPIVSKLETWLIVTIIGLCIVAIGLFSVSAYCMKHIGKLGLTIKEIADGYRIIPVEEYKQNTQDQDSRVAID